MGARKQSVGCTDAAFAFAEDLVRRGEHPTIVAAVSGETARARAARGAEQALREAETTQRHALPVDQWASPRRAGGADARRPGPSRCAARRRRRVMRLTPHPFVTRDIEGVLDHILPATHGDVASAARRLDEVEALIAKTLDNPLSGARLVGSIMSWSVRHGGRDRKITVVFRPELQADPPLSALAVRRSRPSGSLVLATAGRMTVRSGASRGAPARRPLS